RAALQRPLHFRVRAQGLVRGLVLGAIGGAEAQLHRDVATAAGGARGHAALHHLNPGIGEQARDLRFEARPDRAHRADLEEPAALEPVLGVVWLDDHQPMMVAASPEPNPGPRPRARNRGRPPVRRPSGSSCVAQRESCSRLEETQPLLPSSSSTSHIMPSFSPVGYSIIPTSSERTTPLPSGPVNRRAGLVTVTACCALAAEALSGRPPSCAIRSV